MYALLKKISNFIFVVVLSFIIQLSVPLKTFANTSLDGSLIGPDRCAQGIINGFGCNTSTKVINRTNTDAYSVMYYVSSDQGNSLSSCHGYESGMIYEPTGSPLGTPACIGNYKLRGNPYADSYSSDLYFFTDFSPGFDLTTLLTTQSYGKGSIVQSSTITVSMINPTSNTYADCSISLSNTTFNIGQDTSVTMTVQNNTGSTLTYVDIGTVNGSRLFKASAYPAPSEVDETDKTSYFNWGEGIIIPDGTSASFILDVKPVYDWNWYSKDNGIAPGVDLLYAGVGEQDQNKPAGNVLPQTYKYCSSPSVRLVSNALPVVGSPAWVNNPMSNSQVASVSIPAIDGYKGYYGINKGEYYLNNSDPGVGNGVAMAYSIGGGNVYADFSNFTPGIYPISFRVEDNHGNWSHVTDDYLVVYSSTNSSAVGHKSNILPNYGIDKLVGLINTGQTDTSSTAFSVKISNGQITSNSKIHFDYKTGTNCGKATAYNCHNTNIESNSITWLLIDGDNNSQATVAGIATVVIDGTVTTNPFRLIVKDGSLLSPATADQYQLLIYSPGANPYTAQPLYHINEPLTKGSIIVNS